MTTNADIAALLDPGARPEAPGAFRAAVLERMAVRAARIAAWRRAIRAFAVFTALGLIAAMASTANLPAQALAPIAQGLIGAACAIGLAAMLVRGPSKAMARLNWR